MLQQCSSQPIGDLFGDRDEDLVLQDREQRTAQPQKEDKRKDRKHIAFGIALPQMLRDPPDKAMILAQ